MDALERDQSQSLPFLSLDTPVIGTRYLQSLTAEKLNEIRFEPRIVAVNNIKRAVLVSFDQYAHMESRFKEMLKLSHCFLQFSDTLKSAVPAGFEVRLDEFEIRMKLALRKIAEEIPDESPYAEFLDSVLNVANGVFGEEKPEELNKLRDAAKETLLRDSVRRGRKGEIPSRRNITE